MVRDFEPKTIIFADTINPLGEYGQLIVSNLVAEPGLEPGIFASRGRRPTIRRLGNCPYFTIPRPKKACLPAGMAGSLRLQIN